MANRFGNVNKVKSHFFDHETKQLTIEFDFCADKIKVSTITCQAIREGHALSPLAYRFYDFSKVEYFDLRAVEQYQC